MGIDVSILVAQAEDTSMVPTDVEVLERMGETTTYRLHYPVDIREDDLPLLADARLDAGANLTVVAKVAGENQVLVHGPVTGQTIQLVHGGTGSWLQVTGADRSVELDREVHTEVWDGVTASDVVTSIVKRYGLEAQVDATTARYEEQRHTLVQRDTDLRFVRRLARRNGFLFWVDVVDGKDTAHFQRPALDGAPAAKLIINRGTGGKPEALSNLAAFKICWDVERPTSAVATQLHLGDKSDIDGAVPRSPQTALGVQPLATIASGVRSLHIVAPADDAGDLRSRGEGALIEAEWFVQASCETNVHTLKAVVRAHTVVEVQGAGTRHSGKYYVCGVRHVINDKAHTMEIELHRNAWGVA